MGYILCVMNEPLSFVNAILKRVSGFLGLSRELSGSFSELGRLCDQRCGPIRGLQGFLAGHLFASPHKTDHSRESWMVASTEKKNPAAQLRATSFLLRQDEQLGRGPF